MQFVGLGSFYSDKNSVNLATTHVSDISTIELSNAKFDCFYVSTDINLEQYENGMPDEWQKETKDDHSSIVDITLLMTDFKNTCNACSVGFDVKDVTKLMIKKRKNKVGENWNNFFMQPINSAEDFKFTFHDRYCSSKTSYQYCIVPVTNGLELDLNTVVDIYSDFEGWYLADSENFYGSKFNLKRNLSRNTSGNSINTLSGKYPFFSKNSVLNYTSGNIEAIFIGHDNANNFDIENSFVYRKSFYDFLTNGFPKFLKFDTGESLLVQIGDSISQDDGNGVLYAPTTSFDFTEIGDADNYNDLQKNGLLYGEMIT